MTRPGILLVDCRKRFARLYVFSILVTSMKPGESAPSRNLPLHDERYSTTARNGIVNDFDYEPDDSLFHERPITPKVPRLDSSIDRKSLLSNIKDSGKC